MGAVLARVTRTRLAFLARLYRDLGLSRADAQRHARLAYAVYLGIAELRRSHVVAGAALSALSALGELATTLLIPSPPS